MPSHRQSHRSRPSASFDEYGPGPHELGQNLLVDSKIVDRIVHALDGRDLPVVEWAAGRGAITRRLALLGRPVEAVEIDRRSVTHLRRTLGAHVAVTHGDILRHAPPTRAYDLVSNVPFHITTPLLRRLLSLPGWQPAVLITQWEVARKRAGVGGTTLLTAQWWPWYMFALDGRIPASSFAPRPSVDAGLLIVDRRPSPFVPIAQRSAYQLFVKRVFGGPGRGVPDVLVRAGIGASAVRQWARRHDVDSGTLPRDLDARAWITAYGMMDNDAHRSRRLPSRQRW